MFDFVSSSAIGSMSVFSFQSLSEGFGSFLLIIFQLVLVLWISVSFPVVLGSVASR